ncbi:MAG: D-alanyl-D-alanine carboxypeptidase/D-alanyl-D-alanine-endopeptidase [Acidobacteria bacterium]|jgi:D-alanyl-D-alanine carboxypeptidase/D-alanyl-D-alanine-endopeptidase (penicillin-binding protein 4)|nr:D-alanyl-D-alanine carboxypeptidase/D-alanyl-D-alanine-endopeptidase [Acidobacteriota bacterium]
MRPATAIVLGTLLAAPPPAGRANPPAAGAPLPAVVARTLDSVGRAGTGVHAVFTDSGAALASYAGRTPLIPASTMKILSSACALEELGPTFRFRTAFLADAAPDVAGTLRGSLYVRGAGDPALDAERLWAAARELAAVGVQRVTGDLVVDESLFEAPGWPPSWPERQRPSPYNAPQGALALSWDATEIVVLPGAGRGAPARVTASPLRSAAPLANRATTGFSTDLAVFLEDGADGRSRIAVTGTIAAGSAPFRTWIHLGPPGPAVASALAELLREAGIEVRGRARTGVAPAAAVLLLEHESPGLGEIVAGINKPSSNFGAEMLTRALDAYGGGAPGSTAGGTRRIGACLARWGVAGQGLVLADGSGYGRANRLTAEALVGVLLAAKRRPSWRPEFEASLARAAEDGSLRSRLSDLRGRVRAKTGTLNGVSGLAGYAIDRQGRELAFAILLNGPGAGPDDVDRILRALLAAADATPKRAGQAS